MKYTVRYAHLANKPAFNIGDTIKEGELIGIMGTTGQSTALHLHIDCVEGSQAKRYTLGNMESGDPRPAPRQLNWFIDDKLFGTPLEVTTHYADPEYQRVYGKVHSGYDVVPHDRKETTRHFAIYWNRSFPGQVVQVLDDPSGYGNCLYVSYEA